MKTFNLSIEIQIEANSPLEAAKKLEAMLQDDPTELQYYVQEEDVPQVYSVDLAEEDEDAVLPVESYLPIIR